MDECCYQAGMRQAFAHLSGSAHDSNHWASRSHPCRKRSSSESHAVSNHWGSLESCTLGKMMAWKIKANRNSNGSTVHLHLASCSSSQYRKTEQNAKSWPNASATTNGHCGFQYDMFQSPGMTFQCTSFC